MKKTQAVALVAAGPIKKSLIVKSPEVADRLGPVKALRFRVASRIVNTIRAGRPVGSYEELDGCPLLLVSVLDPLVPRIAGELSASGIHWAGKTVLLCDSDRGASALDSLAAAGASVASVSLIEVLDPPRHLLEGDRQAVLAARRLFAGHQRRTIELERGKKALYLAGVSFATSLLTPLAVASVECMRKAGATAQPDLVERLLTRSVRLWRKAGKKSGSGSLTGRGRIEEMRAALAQWAPEFATYFDESTRSARSVLRKRSSQ